MQKWLHRGLVALTLAGLAASALAQSADDCRPVGDRQPICGLRGSEDIEVLSGGRQVLVSQSRVDFTHPPAMHWLAGGIALLDLRSRQPREVYPLHAGPARARWGDSSCPGEIGAQLAPHGLHLSRRADGRHQLLVVNHGARESVEFFEVIGKGRQTRLAWRGCVVAPDFSFLNDVVALPGDAKGGFLVTTMTRNDSPDAMMRDRPKAERGEKTGHVWRWRQGEGFSVLPGSETPMPNGIQVDAQGRAVYVAVSVPNGGVRKLDLASGRELGFMAVPNPDNLSWSTKGQLLVAGLVDDSAILPCLQASFAAPCGVRSHVTAVNPATLAAKRLLEQEGPPMGMFTVAVQAGTQLVIGSAAGDRVLLAPMPPMR